jgi:signal transduction histidine kinase
VIEPPTQSAIGESAGTTELQACIRDLVRVLTLPALCNGREPAEILGLLAEALESTLGLEACYACARVAPEAPLTCVLRIRGASVAADNPDWQCLLEAAGSTHNGPPSLIDNSPIGALRMVSYDMGYFGEGSVCVASSDPQFPTSSQSLVLQAAVTVAASALQSARLARENAEASQARDDFLGLLAHELRNPLAPIVTALNLMKLKSGGGLSREQQIIDRQVGHLSRLVDDLLDVSRIARGKVELTKAPVELSEVIAKAVEIANPLLEQRRHYVRVEAPSSGLVVDGDSARLAQITANLLMNAAKYTEPGGNIAVRAARANGEIELSVKDNGTGIGPDLLPHVFDLFLEGRSGAGRASGSLGIGLSLVKMLVRLHGGSVSAHSAGRGMGSEFVVTLPASGRSAEAAGSPPGGMPKAATAERVVVVDDNRDAAELVGEMLSSVGHDVSVAHDALQALSLIARVKPSVVVLDIGLPVMDGYELASRIRDEFGGNSPRLIAVTGYGLDQDKARSREVGIETHLVKPVVPKDLIAAVAGTA